VGKADSNKQRNADVLRAKDIIPPYNKNIRQELKQSVKEETSKSIGDKAKHTETLSREPEGVEQQQIGIPKFDLANQIMSEQRKTATIKRKGPGKINKATNHRHKVRSTGYSIEPPPKLSQQKQIIAEIVARDIQTLLRGNI